MKITNCRKLLQNIKKTQYTIYKEKWGKRTSVKTAYCHYADKFTGNIKNHYIGCHNDKEVVQVMLSADKSISKKEISWQKAVEDITEKPQPTSSTKAKPSASRLGTPAGFGKAGSQWACLYYPTSCHDNGMNLY